MHHRGPGEVVKVHAEARQEMIRRSHGREEAVGPPAPVPEDRVHPDVPSEASSEPRETDLSNVETHAEEHPLLGSQAPPPEETSLEGVEDRVPPGTPSQAPVQPPDVEPDDVPEIEEHTS
jgi:hypothetical protein